MTHKDVALWGLRMALIALGNRLTAWGVGDAALWAELAGWAVTGAGILWSWFATRGQVDRLPPSAEATLAELRARLDAAALGAKAAAVAHAAEAVDAALARERGR